jgi:hypothetical protein
MPFQSSLIRPLRCEERHRSTTSWRMYALPSPRSVLRPYSTSPQTSLVPSSPPVPSLLPALCPFSQSRISG